MNHTKKTHYLITGGTGFIGQALVNKLRSEESQITIWSPHQQQKDEDQGNLYIASLEHLRDKPPVDVIIHLAGKPINQIWTTKAKKTLYASRVQSIRTLLGWMRANKVSPSLLITASAVGYYNKSSKRQTSFLHKLCSAWEREAMRAQELGTTVCIARFGIVLGQGGGFLQTIHLPFILGLGAILGSGNQWFSWIHIDDLIQGFLHLLEKHNQQEAIGGIYHFVAPSLASQKQVTYAIRSFFFMPTWLRIPAWLITLILGQMGQELLLAGEPVWPARLLRSGFRFSYPTLQEALKQIL